MALKWLRDNLRHLKIILWGVVAVFVLLVFVDWGGGRSGPAGSGEAAIRVGGREVSEQEFIAEMRIMNQRFQQMYGERWNEIRDQVDLAGQTVAYFIDRELQVSEATDAGLAVSEEELRERILADPLFIDQDGAFIGSERYQRVVRSYFRMSPQEFESRYAEDLLVGKLNAMMFANVYVSDSDVEDAFRRQTEVADFDAISLRYEPYLAKVELDESDVRAHYDANPESYRRPEQRVIRYVVVENSKLRRLLPAEEPELQAFYEANREDFMQGEQAHARHVLIRLAPGASDTERTEAELRADGVAKMALSGADFGELATKHSDDPGSKESGGDLGWFGRGQMVKEFEDAVWGAKPGDIIGPVESQFGFHVIRVEGFKPERQQSFDEVQEQVRFRFLEGRAAAEAEVRAVELARRLAADDLQTDEDWQRIADEDEAVVLNVSPPFASGETIPGTGGGVELADEVFQAKVAEVGQPRAIPRGWMVWQLSQIRPEGIAPFEDVHGEIEQTLRRERAIELAVVEAAELIRQWRADADTQGLAEKFGGETFEARDHRWGTAVSTLGVAKAVDEAVFSASVGEVVGPVRLGRRGVLVVKVVRLELMDRAEFEQQGDDIRSRLKAERAQGLLRAMVDERRRDTVITVNNELMERFAPTS